MNATLTRPDGRTFAVRVDSWVEVTEEGRRHIHLDAATPGGTLLGSADVVTRPGHAPCNRAELSLFVAPGWRDSGVVDLIAERARALAAAAGIEMLTAWSPAARAEVEISTARQATSRA